MGFAGYTSPLCDFAGALVPPDSPKSRSKETLQALAAAAQRGAEDAFERLHDRLAGGVRQFLGRRLNSADAVEELAQRAWVAVWEALREGRYDPSRAAISTFVYAVSYRIWQQYLRSERLRRGGVLDGGMLVGPDTLAGDLHEAELIDAMRDALTTSGLTPDEREILDGLSDNVSERAMATRQGVAASTINARKKSALAKLRRRMGLLGFRDSGEEQMEGGERGPTPGE